MPSVDLSPDTLARIEAQLQADLDAVRRVRALLTAHPSHAPQPAQPAARAAAEEKNPPLPEGIPAAMAAPPVPAPVVQIPPPAGVAIPRAVALLDGEFGIKAVKATLSREHLGGHMDREIRGILNRMVKKGELRVVNAGRGRGGSTYQRIVKS